MTGTSPLSIQMHYIYIYNIHILVYTISERQRRTWGQWWRQQHWDRVGRYELLAWPTTHPPGSPEHWSTHLYLWVEAKEREDGGTERESHTCKNTKPTTHAWVLQLHVYMYMYSVYVTVYVTVVHVCIYMNMNRPGMWPTTQLQVYQYTVTTILWSML